ncbi:biotin/lipoyl-containing protein [Thermococcus sp. MV5]|uniref:biotin/lipoyl-containing protein n=1 Tax=Thermococcus sp. MV5 TaxID=1638272 RepID=UPI0023FA36C8|nr:biotin/lipoyl-containing protein [Thermococcus sp. MV5]
MPKLGLTMETGVIREWLKKLGDRVEEGEVIAIVESEKLTGEIKAPVAGILAEVLYEEGDEVPVGEVVAYLEVSEK